MAIESECGSLEDFIAKFNAAGAGVQGSGWVVSCSEVAFPIEGSFHVAPIFLSFCTICQWLGLNKDLKKLAIQTTANQVRIMNRF